MRHVDNKVPAIEIKTDYVFDFGKHEGESLEQVILEDHTYVEWCLREIDWFLLDRESGKFLQGVIDEFEDYYPDDNDKDHWGDGHPLDFGDN